MFWDRFIRSIYGTFGNPLPGALSAATHILAEAHVSGLLDLPLLQDGSVVLLVMMCPQGTALACACRGGI